MNDYFLFSNSERKGIFVLLCILFCLFCLWIGIPYILKPEKADFSEYNAQIEKWRQKEVIPAKEASLQITPSNLFVFDPNKVDSLQMIKLGFTLKQIRNVLQYRQKGGVFRKKEDLKKIYGFAESDYSRMEPWILINRDPGFPGYSYKKESADGSVSSGQFVREERKNAMLIELNTADSIMLTSLPGIGPVFAQRILKYRNLLGGYHHREQLLEVYGFSLELFEKVASRLEVDTTLIIPIHLNGDPSGSENRKRHPYLDLYSQRSLETYKRSRQKINSVDELIDNKVLSPEVYLRIRPYLTTK